jgi:ABC-type Fe3+/spermidine/putrescine transport system ATPase subunit
VSRALACEQVSVRYGKTEALSRVDLTVEDGETLALLGPSGSGKTTLLYAIAGFLSVTNGSIEIAGRTVSDARVMVRPEERDLGLVFQNYALWPHLSAEETVAYPLQRSGVAKREAIARAREILATVGIGELGGRKPAEMSGGQQQRVGLARALARDARLYLFDEPTAHLDSSVRGAVQEEIARRRRETGAAAVYSTHDSAEALASVDRVAILRAGSVVQIASPTVIYERPVDVWAARLSGPASVLDGVATGTTGGKLEVHVGDNTIVADTGSEQITGPVTMIVRPDWVTLGGPIRGVVRELWFRGPHTDYRVETSMGPLEVRHPGLPLVGVGESAGWTLDRAWVPG